VGDVLSEHEATDEVMCWSGFTAVRTEHERVETSLAAPADKLLESSYSRNWEVFVNVI